MTTVVPEVLLSRWPAVADRLRLESYMRVLRDLHQARLEITPLHQFCIAAAAAVSAWLLLRSTPRRGRRGVRGTRRRDLGIVEQAQTGWVRVV